MDPFTAFCIACNVMQAVDFGTKLVAASRQIYKDGSSEEHL